MNQKLRFILCVVLGASLLLTVAWTHTHHQSFPFAHNGGFEPVDCQQFAAEPSENHYCTYFYTAYDHDRPVLREAGLMANYSEMVKLPVVLATASADAIADKAVIITGGGGPGNSLGMGVPGYKFQDLLHGMDVFHRMGIDVILVDQRGVGLSYPNMSCPELGGMYRELLESDAGPMFEIQSYQSIMSSCREKWVRRDIDLAHMDTRDSARDFLDLMDRLPYREWIVLGVSYGAQVAYEMAVQRPDSVSYLVLDSLPAFSSEAEYITQSQLEGQIKNVLRQCAVNKDCAARYPGLLFHFAYLKRRYDNYPEHWEMSDGSKLLVTKERLIRFLYQALYRPEFIAALPKAIHAAAYDHDNRLLMWLASDYYAWMTDTDYGDLLSANIYCEVGYPLQQQRIKQTPEIRREWTASDEQYWFSGAALCDRWGVAPDTERFEAPVEVYTPTLILSGEYDPVTPPGAALEMQAWLSRSRFVLDPSKSHAILANSRCAQDQLQLFLQYRLPREREQYRCNSPELVFN